MLTLLKVLNFISAETENNDELKLGQVLCHYLACVMPNIHTTFELKNKPGNPTSMDMVAVAMFPNIAAHINHSCDPNTFVIDQGRVQITVAARTILAGEEISHIYFGHFGDTTKEKRQEYILKKYNFLCNCNACENDFPKSEMCLEIAKTFVETPRENLTRALSEEELNNLVVKALDKNQLPLALELSKKRFKLISEH